MRKIVNVNFKKFLTSSFLLWVFISAIIPTCYAYEMSSVGVINLRNLYSTYDPTEVKGKINEGPPFSGSLFYKNIPYGNSSIELKVELNSVEKANFFSGKRVDIFTLEYSPPCNSNIKKNSYGGITLSDGNRIDKKNIPVNPWC